MLKKIGLIGGGYIGGVLTQEIVQRRLAREVGLTDPAPFVNPQRPEAPPCGTVGEKRRFGVVKFRQPRLFLCPCRQFFF